MCCLRHFLSNLKHPKETIAKVVQSIWYIGQELSTEKSKLNSQKRQGIFLFCNAPIPALESVVPLQYMDCHLRRQSYRELNLNSHIYLLSSLSKCGAINLLLYVPHIVVSHQAEGQFYHHLKHTKCLKHTDMK